MRIVSIRVQPISIITTNLIEKRKSQKEIIDEIKALQKQSPRGKFFAYLGRQYGMHEVNKFKEALLDVQTIYSEHKDMVDIYKELDKSNPIDIYKANQITYNNAPRLSIYASDMAQEKEAFIQRIDKMNLPMTYSVFFSVNNTYEPEPYINLSAIVVDKNSRKEGVGSRFMEELINTADKLKAIVVLTPSSDFGSSMTKLREFYSKFGFKRNLGRNKDYRFSEAMIRLPKNK